MPARLPPKVSTAQRGAGISSPRGFFSLTFPPPTPCRCLVKWLEVRCVCPMCNKPMAGPAQPRAGIGTLLDELV